MPAQPKYPIDDNTLFILLALRYQRKIEIDGLDSVYDWYVNYGRTVINPDNEPWRVEEIAERGINWICKTYNIEPERPTNKKTILETYENSKLESDLSDYFERFSKYENGYYHDEERHKKRLYEFVKSESPDVLDYPGKYFSYKFLPEENPEKFKMIEYVGFLIHSKILCLNTNPFDFDAEKGLRQKVINIKSESQEKILDLFKDYIEQDKYKQLMEEIKKSAPLCESEKFKLFDAPKNNVFYKNKNRFLTLRETGFKLLKYCIENKKDFITVEEYVTKVNTNIEIRHAKKHFSLLNNDLKIKVFLNQRGRGWIIST